MNLRGFRSFPADLPDFDTSRAPDQPAELFVAWLEDAAEDGLAAHAATLSTVDESGVPDCRVVILKDVNDEGWYFATSMNSPKGKQLSENPNAALAFFWPHRGRQVRVRGRASPMSRDASAEDFLARPYDARIDALIDRQSDVLSDEADLESAVEAARRRATERPEEVPESWTRYRVVGELVEFWQGRHDRLHVRLRYRRQGSSWIRERLWP